MIIYRPDFKCSHWIKTSADQWPDVRLSDVDVAEALGKALSVKVAYVHTAWPRLSADFEADRFDMAMGGISITPEREA